MSDTFSLAPEPVLNSTNPQKISIDDGTNDERHCYPIVQNDFEASVTNDSKVCTPFRTTFEPQSKTAVPPQYVVCPLAVMRVHYG